MHDAARRSALRTILVSLSAGAAVLLAPLRALAAWPKAAFDAKSVKDATDALFKSAPIQSSDKVSIVAPDLAENGTIVPITVLSELPGIETITILADENPRPLTSTYRLGKRAQTPLSVRVKLAKTQNITAVVQSQGKLYSATKRITVSVGGCGG